MNNDDFPTNNITNKQDVNLNVKMNNKNTIFYTIMAIAVLSVAVASATYAYFSQGITSASKTLTVSTPATASFTATGLTDLSITTDLANMTSAKAGWNITKTTTVDITASGTADAYCTYVISVVKGSTPVYNTSAGGLFMSSAWNTTPTSDSYTHGSTSTTFTSETDYGSVSNVVSNGVIVIPNSGSITHKININLIWKNLSSNQDANSGKTFTASLKVTNINCYTSGGTLINSAS